jgi:arginase
MSKGTVHVFSLPYHDGRRAVAMGRGPIELLERHGLAAELERRGFDPSVEEIAEPEEGTAIGRTIELDRRLAARVREATDRYAFPLVLSGNCSSCLGTLAGLLHDVGIVWFDGHADFDTPDDNLSGFFDVMALAIATGSGWNVYVHVDLDVLDPAEGRANEYAAPGGLSLEMLTDAIALVGEWLEVRAAAVTAYDPSFDQAGEVARAAVAVAAVAVDAGVRRTS